MELDPTSAPTRRLEIVGAYNVRDLGGYPTTDGRTTRRGRFVRADLLARLPPESQASLVDYGIRTVIDLRTTAETRQAPSVFGGSPLVQYRHCDLMADLVLPIDWGFSPRSLADAYASMMDAGRAQIRDVLATMASPDALPAAFHCHGGTDRTGIVAALLLGLAGVPEEVIAADYALSARGLVDGFVAEGAPKWMRPDDLTSGRALGKLAPAEAMRLMLRRVVERYGDVEGYARVIGLTEGQIAALRESLVE